MDSDEPIRLNARLRTCGDQWAAVNGASLAALGRLAINDSSFFNRIDSPRGTTTATLERFAQFLTDPANWPDGAVPPEVCEFAHVVGISSAACSASAGCSDEMSGALRQAQPFGEAQDGNERDQAEAAE